MAQDPHPGAAQAANINPKDVAPSHMNSRQKEAVANVVADDAAKGATVYVSRCCDREIRAGGSLRRPRSSDGKMGAHPSSVRDRTQEM